VDHRGSRRCSMIAAAGAIPIRRKVANGNGKGRSGGPP
jgi:hypothetical protein